MNYHGHFYFPTRTQQCCAPQSLANGWRKSKWHSAIHTPWKSTQEASFGSTANEIYERFVSFFYAIFREIYGNFGVSNCLSLKTVYRLKKSGISYELFLEETKYFETNWPTYREKNCLKHQNYSAAVARFESRRCICAYLDSSIRRQICCRRIIHASVSVRLVHNRFLWHKVRRQWSTRGLAQKLALPGDNWLVMEMQKKVLALISILHDWEKVQSVTYVHLHRNQGRWWVCSRRQRQTWLWPASMC